MSGGERSEKTGMNLKWCAFRFILKCVLWDSMEAASLGDESAT